MIKLRPNKWYKRKSDNVKMYCYELSLTGAAFGYFSLKKGGLCEDILWPREVDNIGMDVSDLLDNHNLSRLSTAMGKHRSYLNKMIQKGVSDKAYNKIKSKITIDWNSDKPLYVDDRKHVPFYIKPVNCLLPKHKEWLQSLMMKGCIKI